MHPRLSIIDHYVCVKSDSQFNVDDLFGSKTLSPLKKFPGAGASVAVGRTIMGGCSTNGWNGRAI